MTNQHFGALIMTAYKAKENGNWQSCKEYTTKKLFDNCFPTKRADRKFVMLLGKHIHSAKFRQVGIIGELSWNCKTGWSN